MNPLSFITFFTVGELVTMTVLALAYRGATPLWHELIGARAVMFWLMLGGFVWVIGDLFQQYATKYVGISRGIPLSNTNQLGDCCGASWFFMNCAAEAKPSTRKSPEDRCSWPWEQLQSLCHRRRSASTRPGRTPPIGRPALRRRRRICPRRDGRERNARKRDAVPRLPEHSSTGRSFLVLRLSSRYWRSWRVSSHRIASVGPSR